MKLLNVCVIVGLFLRIIDVPHVPVDVDRDGDVDLADFACLQNDAWGHADFVDWMGGPGVDALGYRYDGRIVTVCCGDECWDFDCRETR